MLRSLVGSEMCIRDSFSLIGDKKIEAIRLYLSTHNPRYSNKLELSGSVETKEKPLTKEEKKHIRAALKLSSLRKHCLLYTSDAADDLLCVDLGRRRIIKKKKTTLYIYNRTYYV